MLLKNIFFKLLAKGSLRVTSFSACQLCFWLMYQEDISEETKKLLKEKTDEYLN